MEEEVVVEEEEEERARPCRWHYVGDSGGDRSVANLSYPCVKLCCHVMLKSTKPMSHVYS